MLRRPATSITLTADDLAIFEKQYASGQIYSDHHERNSINSDANDWSQRQDTATPGSAREDGQMASSAGEVEVLRAQADTGGEDKRVKSRAERIQGTTAAGAGSSGIGNASGSGRGAGGAGTTQQQR
jgi:Anaphase-promoting complex APC subunit CDC26